MNKDNSVHNFKSLNECNENSKPSGSWLLWRLVSIFVHVIALTLYTYTLCYSLINYHRFRSNHPNRLSIDFQQREFAGKWKFLTHWNHVLQLVYFAFAVTLDLCSLALPIQPQSNSVCAKSRPISLFQAIYSALDNWINLLFHALVVPSGLLVCILFWTLFAIDGGLVVYAHSVPEPSWLMHTQHSLVAVIVILELCLTPRPLPSSTSTVKLSLLFIGSYLCQLFTVGLLYHHWAYGILAKLSTLGRSGFVIAAIALYSLLALLSRHLYSFIWSLERFHRYHFGFAAFQDHAQNKPIP